MTLRKRVVEFPLTGGIDTKKSGKTVEPPTLLELRNGRYQAEGRIDKRFGFMNIGLNLTSGTLSTPQSIVGFRDELVLFTSDHLYSYSSTDGKWYTKGEATAAKTTLHQVSDSDTSSTGVDCIVSGGISVTIWLEGTNYYYSIIDEVTKNRLRDRTVFKSSASSTYARLLTIGNYIVILYNDGSDLKYVRIPLAAPTVTTAGTAISNMDSAGYFEAAGLNNFGYVLYKRSGATNLEFSKLDIDLLVAETLTLTGYSVTSHKSLAVLPFRSTGDSETYIALGWADSPTNDVIAALYTVDLVAEVAPAILDSTIAAVAEVTHIAIALDNDTQTRLKYFITHVDVTTSDYFIRQNTLTTAGVFGTSGVFLRSVGLASKAIQIDGLSYLNVLFDSPLQPTYFTVSTNGKVVAKFVANQGGSHSAMTRLSNLTLVPNTTTSCVWACLRKGRIQSENAVLFATTSPQLATLSLDPTDRPPTIRVHDDLLIGGGILSAYDGQSVTEYGFHMYPEVLTAAYGTSGTVVDGTYLVYSVYSWTDAQGVRHQSAPGQVTATVVGPDDEIIVTVPALRLTSKTSDLDLVARDSVKIRTFITEAGGTVPYFVDETDNPDILTADSIDVTISSIPGDLTTREILYTSGGELENIAAPSHSYLFTHGNRPVLVGLENRSQIAFGKDIKPQTGVGFHEDFVLTMDPLGGDCVAGASMDTSMIIFKETATYVIAGAGPNDLGEGTTFSVPQLISSDIGCRDPKSVLQTPQGILFMSNKGIYILNRALQLEYIGAPVEAYNDLTVVSSTILTTSNEIRFLTSSNVTLVYNYYFKRWGIYDTPNAVSATSWQNSGYVYLTDTKVLQESADTYLDDGSYVSTTIRTGWIHTAGLQGFQRLYRLGLLGTYHTNNAFRVRAFYDYSEIPSEVKTITAGDLVNTSLYGDDALYGDSDFYGGSNANEVYQASIHLARQKCESVSFEIHDSAVGNSTGQGFSLEGIALEVAGIGGIFRSASSRRL